MVIKDPQGMPVRKCASEGQRGFTYLGVLIAIAIMGIGLSAVSEVWVRTARQQKQEELDWIGKQFTQAIGSYYLSTPGGAWVYPASLDDLLEDRRFATTRRHLREIYANPFSGKPDWEVVMGADGRVHGVLAAIGNDASSTLKTFAYAPATL